MKRKAMKRKTRINQANRELGALVFHDYHAASALHPLFCESCDVVDSDLLNLLH